ncbi:ArsR family transcriptional regulator [Alcanivorax profundi]|uniref:ArsR family transcriptional regulator n=1 Tax=Alcanivorax profundi TaxID=2338368 RepID=A0A418Y219_9GAMM|nr:ArsR family transcriptional regulator [Alcanivorax profundi]
MLLKLYFGSIIVKLFCWGGWVLAQTDTVSEAQLVAAFRALANPNRLRIYQQVLAHCREKGQADLQEVSAGCAFGDFMKRLNIGKPTVSHHVKELVEAGLIRVEQVGRRRFCLPDIAMQSRLGDFFHV